MSEPFFKATTPDDRVAVEVREEGDGAVFTCTVTLDGITVLDELCTRDQTKMVSWTKRQMVEAMRRCKRP